MMPTWTVDVAPVLVGDIDVELEELDIELVVEVVEVDVLLVDVELALVDDGVELEDGVEVELLGIRRSGSRGV